MLTEGCEDEHKIGALHIYQLPEKLKPIHKVGLFAISA